MAAPSLQFSGWERKGTPIQPLAQNVELEIERNRGVEDFIEASVHHGLLLFGSARNSCV